MKKLYDKLNVKIGQLKWRAKKAVNNTLIWIDNNKEFVIFIAPVVFGFGKWFAKTTTKAINNKKEKDNKDLYTYDPSSGFYYQLRRPLTGKEKQYIDNLMHDERHPMRKGDILEQMKVLK